MYQTIRPLQAFFLALLLYLPCALESDPPQPAGKLEELFVKYRLIDLGESDVPLERLSRHLARPSLAPSINNDGQIIGNRAEGGFLRDPFLGEWVPYTHDVTINFHALTNNGDLLVSLNRKSNPTEWMVWPTTTGKNGPRQPIQLGRFPNTQFLALTNLRMAIGNAIVDGKTIPVVWKANEQVQSLEDPQGQGKALTGQIKGVNNEGQVVAFLEQGEFAPPAAWSPSSGVQYMKNFRAQVLPNATAQLVDLFIVDDGTAYGTYQIKYTDTGKISDYYTYAWLPFDGGGFKLLDLDGMQLAAVNDWHTLVGALEGEAAICEPGTKPQKLSKAIRESERNGWELLEATGINNWGDIVGYGRYKGNTHVFLLQKENSQAPYMTSSVSKR